MKESISKSGSQDSIGSYASSRANKYDGVIEVSYIKSIRRTIHELFSYIYSVSPEMVLLNNLMTWIRIFQLIGISFCIVRESLWINGKDSKSLIDGISFLLLWFSKKQKEDYGYYILLGFSLKIGRAHV